MAGIIILPHPTVETLRWNALLSCGLFVFKCHCFLQLESERRTCDTGSKRYRNRSVYNRVSVLIVNAQVRQSNLIKRAWKCRLARKAMG
jgi:hypothetical protein